MREYTSTRRIQTSTSTREYTSTRTCGLKRVLAPRVRVSVGEFRRVRVEYEWLFGNFQRVLILMWAYTRVGSCWVRLAILGARLELLELSLEGAPDEARGCPPSALAQTDRFAVIHVSLQALYRQVGSLLPNVQVFHTLCLWATPEGAKAEDHWQLRLAPTTSACVGIVFLFFLFQSVSFARIHFISLITIIAT
ncbi:hypothetical protein EDB84DRAFT_1442851 [Lactarius hengduanensis]|nr:hypothetical protein EDB84DRAFT_1442851 [Lactarius hengduanensis]